ncbi:CDK5 regulatory subunit-associated protein 2 isoform X3 [Pygocentrus nattereri]|uniref:CDK5 regulatory subunit-associated protein 2 isoform X3 n=1 Tax=Pygocentrus nattereri TaxID=42514 RepID=UPI000814348F|nr:CDK5 regulatory subunit-associated protein 2 isoform X3 [Pygocentrus nattereri]
MREPCRVCGVCVPGGGQCRWLFSTCGRLRLAVVLSHVLGCDLHRDGRGEFLCGKCVFLLERVVQCDVAIGNLQDAHAAQLQKLHNERDGLRVLIAHKYQQNNPQEPTCSGQKNQNQQEPSQFRKDETRPGQEYDKQPAQLGSYQHCVQTQLQQRHQQNQLKRQRNKTRLIMELPQKEQPKQQQKLQGRRRSSGVHNATSRGSLETGQLRRCVSLEPLSGVTAERSSSSSFGSSLATRKGREAGLKAGPMLGTGVQSRNREYSDLIHKRATLSSRSVSLQSLTQERPDCTPFTLRQTRSRRGSSSATLETSSLLSDFLQLLRRARARPLPLTVGSKIPVLSQPSCVFGLAQMGMARRVKAERALRELEEEYNDEYMPLKQEVCVAKEGEVNRLQQMTRQLTEELKSTKNSSQTLKQRLEEMERENKTLSVQLEERDSELAAEKRNSLKRDKTIQGLSLLLKEKEKEVEELYGNLEEKDQVLAKAREALHKAQLQKYQGAEEQQALLLSQQAELSRLQAEAHSSLLEAQRLQRLLSSRDAELALLQQDKLQLEQELELLQQQKRKADKTINDLQNQLKKLRGELADRENSLEHQQLEQQERTRATENKLQTTIQHLTTSLTHKEQQLQDYMNMVQDLEQDRAPGGSDAMLVKLRERLREKEKALEKALDEKYAAVEEKENEIHLLQLNVREKERDLERLNNLLTHNEETINSFDALLKEKDVELQQLLNSLKNVQRSKQESEDNLQRALREKDSIIQHLQHTLELKTKDMEEMASTVLSQSESQGRDLIEQMNQRIKLTEVMLTEAVKDRERLVCENQTAVENLLATINSKDQLLKECAERHAQALSEWTAELQNLRSQLTDAQLQLSSAQKLNSMATQDTSLETAQLRAALAEKDAVINKLLERGQERDRYMAEVKVGETPPPQVLELRQTIEVLQERLEEREAELSRRNSEENLEKSLPGSKKSAVILKKELAQKTDALNSALKRENQLKMSLAELQSVVSELEGQLEGQKANIESLASTLNTKEEIIAELQQRLVQRGENRLAAARDHLLQPGEEHSFPSLPQRERTLIGGDSQQEAMPSVVDLRLEQAELNRILRAEQQLYSNLVRAVKEQDSAQRLQALQLELAALTLLRQQLEDGIRCNEELREHLHREIQRASQREGADPAELESMRDALEEAHRWNASLQARLGQIQSRGGGVGQANDSVDTLSLIGEQTSYMSICVGEALDEELSVEQLRLKMSELQALNAELQRKLATTERGVVGNVKGASDLIDLSSPSKQPQGLGRPLAANADEKLTGPDVKEKINERAHSPEDQSKIVSSSLAQPLKGRRDGPHASEQQSCDDERAELASLLMDCGAGSLSQLREQVAKLRLEASELRGLLKEENSAEYKESAESSGESDSHTDLHQTVRTLRSEARSHRKVIRLLKEQLQRNSAAAAAGGTGFDPELIVSMAREMERLRAENEASQKHALSLEDRLKEKDRERNEAREQEEEKERKEKGRQGQSVKMTKGQKHQMARHAAYVRSRLPVPVRPKKQTEKRELSDHDTEESTEYRSGTDSDQPNLSSRHLKGAEAQSSVCSSSEPLWGSESKQNTYPEAAQSPLAKPNADKVSEVQESELLTQLELLNQECQEKEELISRLQLQRKDWERLEAELQERDKLNSQYREALEAAESTIAYLTACSLDTESGLGQSGSGSDSTLQRQCEMLQRALQEKDQLNAQLLECLNTAEAAIASLTTSDRPESPSRLYPSQGDPQELSDRLEGLLNQIKALQEHKDAFTGAAEKLSCPDEGSAVESDLQRQAESLQESLLRQCRLNAELQEKLRSAEETITKLSSNANTPKQSSIAKGLEEEEVLEEGQSRLIACLSECILAAEQAVESVANFCSKYSQPSHGSEFNTEVEQNLHRLLQAFLERDQYGVPDTADLIQSSIAGPPQNKSVQHTLQIIDAGLQKTSTPISQGQQNQNGLTSLWNHNLTETLCAGQAGSTHLNLHKNLLVLLQLIKERAQKIQELEKQLKDEQRRALREQVGVKTEEAQESLMKILKDKQKVCQNLEEKLKEKHEICQNLEEKLKEKHKVCQSLEEKLTTAQSMIALQNLTERDKHMSRCKDVDGVAHSDPALSPVLKRALAGFSSAENLDSAASSPSYPSSPDISSPRPCDSSADPVDPNLDPALLRQQLQQLRSQVEAQHKVIQHLQRLLRKKSLSAETLSITSDPSGRQEEEDKQALEARIAQLTVELERERTMNRSTQPASPSKIESLVQSQARELCELREQIRVSRGLGVEQRRQLQDLRVALEELLQPSDGQPVLDTTLRQHLDRSLSLLEKLEQGDTCLDNKEGAGLELAQRLSAELQEKDKQIQQLKDRLHGRAARKHQDSDSEMSDRISNDGTASFHDSPPSLRTHTFSRASTGTKVTNGVIVSETATSPFPGSVSGLVGLSEGSIRMLQRENGRLQEQLKSSEELNATLRSELDLTRSVLTNTHGQRTPSPAHTHDQSQTTDRKQEPQLQVQQESSNKCISSDLLSEHLQEIRALRQRLEETIRTNERLREQLERKLLEAERDPAATNIFIAGSEEPAQLSSELHLLLAQNRSLKEQLNQGARDKHRENDRLRETLARRTAKLELSRRECEILSQEHAHLQDNLYRLQCESKLQKQQLADTQQLLQSVQVELQVHEQIKNSAHTHTGDEHSGSDSGKVDLGELLNEVRRLRLQLERSIQTNTALRHKLEQQLLTRNDPPSTININYLLHKTDEGGKSGMHHTDACSASHDSGSSVRSGSPAPSRLVPGHRLWADRHGRHVLGLIEDYNALRKQISEAKRLNAAMDTRLQESNRIAECKALSGSVNTMQQVLEEAGRLLKLLWRVSLPSGDLTNMQQDEVLRSEISCLKSRLSQQERMLTGAVKRLRTSNQLKEGMERIIIDQLSLTHGVLKKARGNLESNYLSVFGLKGLQTEGNPTESPVANQPTHSLPRGASTPQQNSSRNSVSSEERHSDDSSHCSC